MYFPSDTYLYNNSHIFMIQKMALNCLEKLEYVMPDKKHEMVLAC